MKPKNPSEAERITYPAARETLHRYINSARRHLPWDWWLHPMFYIEIDVPFAQVAFLYWQMIWLWDDYQAPLWERKIEKFFGIYFLPD